jgi:glyoxylase-like metal-dependent hydrolase (beta-lactamase superfamily II)
VARGTWGLTILVSLQAWTLPSHSDLDAVGSLPSTLFPSPIPPMPDSRGALHGDIMHDDVRVILLDRVGDVKLLPIPGHTPGSMAILYKGFLFTGDSMHYSRIEGHLVGTRFHCW